MSFPNDSQLVVDLVNSSFIESLNATEGVHDDTAEWLLRDGAIIREQADTSG